MPQEIDDQLLENLMIEFIHIAMIDNNERAFIKRIKETRTDYLIDMLYALNSIGLDILNELTERNVRDESGS